LVFMNYYFVDKLFICFSFRFKVIEGFINGTNGHWKIVNIYFYFFYKIDLTHGNAVGNVYS
jgi:hypothetical protein